MAHARVFPFLEQIIKILGVTFYGFMGLDSQFCVILCEAMMRQSILLAVANSSLGLDSGVLEIAHGAFTNSLMRHAIGVVGSFLPPDLCVSTDTRTIDVAARKSSGLGRPARI